VLAAIRRDRDEISADLLDALQVGRMVKAAGGGGSRVLPGPAWSQVTRELRVESSFGLKN